MINQDKETKAIKAIYDLIIVAKVMAGNGENVFAFLDSIEILPALLLEEKNKTRQFELYLQTICNEYDCKFPYVNYSR